MTDVGITKKRLLVYGFTWGEPRNAIFLHHLSRYFHVLAITPPLCKNLTDLAAPADFRTESFFFPGKVGLGFLMKFPQIAREFRPDIILSLETHSISTFQTVFLAKSLRVRSAVFTWQNVPSIPRYLVQKVPQYYSIRNVDYLLAGSTDAIEYLVEKGATRQKISVIPETGYDKRIFTPDGPCLRKQWGYCEKDFIVLLAGRIVAEKGIDHILSVARSFDNLYPHIKFVFVGSGAMTAAVIDAGLSNVSYKGKYDFLEMGAVMRACDLFLYPSLSTRYWIEQFGYSPIEAIACGKPAIVSDSGTLKRLVLHGTNGSVFPEGDRERLATSILEWYRRWQNGSSTVDPSSVSQYCGESVATGYARIFKVLS